MRILSKEEAKKIDVEFIYRRGEVLAITENDFNRRFDIVPKERNMGSTQLEAEIIDGMFRCPLCKSLSKKLGICRGCGKVLIRKKV